MESFDFITQRAHLSVVMPECLEPLSRGRCGVQETVKEGLCLGYRVQEKDDGRWVTLVWFGLALQPVESRRQGECIGDCNGGLRGGVDSIAPR